MEACIYKSQCQVGQNLWRAHLVEMASSTFSETWAHRNNVKVVKEEPSVYIWPTHMPTWVSMHIYICIQCYNTHTHMQLPCKPACHAALRSQCYSVQYRQWRPSSCHPLVHGSMSLSHSSHLGQQQKPHSFLFPGQQFKSK